MISKNKALEKLEQDLFKEINNLKAKYLEQVKELATGYNLESFAKIYHSSRDFNFNSDTIDNNIEENIDFVNDAVAHQLTSFIMIEKLQDRLLQDIQIQLLLTKNKFKKELFSLNEDKEVYNPKTRLNKILQNIFNTKPYPPKLIDAINLAELSVNLINKISHKISNICENRRPAIYDKYSFFISDEEKKEGQNDFTSIKAAVKEQLKTTKVVKALNEEMNTYRLSERYDKILKENPLKLEKLFTKHVGKELADQLTLLKDRLDEQINSLVKEANTFEHVLANISTIESDMIKGFLVTPFDMANEKASALKDNLKEVSDPSKRNKKIGKLLAGMVALTLVGASTTYVFDLFNIKSLTQQEFIKNSVDNLFDKDKGIISLAVDASKNKVEENNKKFDYEKIIDKIIESHQNYVTNKKVKIITKSDNEIER